MASITSIRAKVEAKLDTRDNTTLKNSSSHLFADVGAIRIFAPAQNNAAYDMDAKITCLYIAMVKYKATRDTALLYSIMKNLV